MSYQLYQPRYPLDQFIQCLWHADFTVSYTREKILPTGTVELIINFGSPFRIYNSDEGDHFTTSRKSWLVGLQTRHILNEPMGETHMIGVRFRPGGTFPFFDFSAHEIHNQTIDLDLILGAAVESLRQQLYDCGGAAARFALMEYWLLKHMNERRSTQRQTIHLAVHAIIGAQGLLSIKDLGDKIGYSQKHLAVQFKQVVGVTPKVLARIFRFQTVLETIDPRQAVDWSQVAHACYYYDQSHFNRDFMAFTGLRPSEYLMLRQAHYGVDVAPGEGVHFVPVA